MTKKLSVIVPVFNEKDSIESVINAIKSAPKNDLLAEIIIVDDFSVDGTREKIQSFSNSQDVKIFLNDKNRGKGFSVRRGLKEASGDYLIIQDADLEYDPKEYPTLLENLMNGSSEVVYGSRFKGKPFVFKAYYLANRFLTLLSNIFTGQSITDMETCYKCFTKNVVDQISPNLKANRFDIEPEITAFVSKSGFKIIEVPISYRRRSYEEGKKIGFKDGLEAIWTIIKNTF